ncbi:MAG TPA: tRNA uridine-5-carboxymethylaminomethyl(34) synthesis GTPase MnmE [Clostridiales bacterium]|jgi:tRNA modification GTPase|nr:tRNA uridine-5-carboxymethylaminomethyl(34) synthesis GTPase MnmE [Clostridiales bacterium]
MDTIAAISTAYGVSGIGIIRISGDEAVNIADKIFKSKQGKNLKELEERKLNYGWIINPSNKEKVDEVLTVYMNKPYTYTKEDVVEINCHGGIVPLRKILDIILEQDCRLAERGEFTKRAFLNGRLDLTQAESVMDIISSKTEKSMSLSMDQLQGRLSKQVNEIVDELMELKAHLEVNIDFPEYDEEELTKEKIKEKAFIMKENIEKLISSADTGKIFKEGINTLILGKPNVGKSSLMNFLLNENRSIVTEVPGTTRDTIEEFVNLAGVPLNIIDTAGIRYTDDIVEKIGVQKAIDKIDDSDLIIMIFDASKELEEDDEIILNNIENKKVIYLMNKTDLNTKIDLTNYKEIEKEVIKISLLKNEGLEEIETKVKEEFLAGNIDANNDLIVTNTRHKNLLKKANNSLKELLGSIEAGLTLECLEVDINDTIHYLGEITGSTVSESVIEKIFSNFCIGK